MAVSYGASKSRVAAWADNARRWDGVSRGHFEVWFLTLNHRASQRGFWLRYTIDSPQPAVFQQRVSTGSLESPVALWAGYFDRKNPNDNFVIKRSFEPDPQDPVQSEADRVSIGPGFLTADQAVGQLETDEHRITWDLGFAPSASTYHHVNPAVNRMLRPSSFIVSPNISTRFNGRITVDGHDI